MYLVQFINPAKFLDAIYAVMSEKLGFCSCDGEASGVFPAREDEQAANISE